MPADASPHTNVVAEERIRATPRKRGRDLLREGLRQSGLVCVTSHERIPPGELEKPLIDHICLPEAWAQRSKVVEAWPGTVGGVRLSDHSAVVVEVAK
jgi:hypothetical protein